MLITAKRLIPLGAVMATLFLVPACSGAQALAQDEFITLLSGTDPVTGRTVNAPPDWPDSAGAWNARVAAYNAATDRIVFESHREDIRGGSWLEDGITAAGVSAVFVAGPGTGRVHESGTSVLYVAAADGSEPRCIGCVDIVDGAGGVEIYKVMPSAAGRANRVERQPGATVYANQNKDLAAFHPSGDWIVAAVEMPRHALRHQVGSSSLGMFNDLWAIHADGRIWVQLTDFRATWDHADPVASTPYACADAPNCPLGCQYVGTVEHPYDAYACSARGAPPPSIGTMRPRVSHRTHGGSARLVWSERVGIKLGYTWGGTLQLARADLVMVDGLPALVNYARNLTPTPTRPDGRGLWSNPGGGTVIGAGYESWDFSETDDLIGVASDTFFSTSSPFVKRTVSPSSQAFTDAIAWLYNTPTPMLFNLTRYDRNLYAYEDNGAPWPAAKYGHWEEPLVFSEGARPAFYAFASSVNLDPPWNPLEHRETFGLDVWVAPLDRSRPARRVTHVNAPGIAPRWLVYPTDFHPGWQALYITRVPHEPAANLPGSLWRLSNIAP